MAKVLAEGEIVLRPGAGRMSGPSGRGLPRPTYEKGVPHSERVTELYDRGDSRFVEDRFGRRFWVKNDSVAPDSSPRQRKLPGF
jgi:hypothetical protein